MNFLTKGTSYKVKDIDETNRKVLISVAGIGNVDAGGDMIMPGAFKKTIKERGPSSAEPRIKHLVNHDRWAGLVGKPLEMRETRMMDGFATLDVLSVLSDSQLGRDTLENYKVNLYEHSIGYDVAKSTVIRKDPMDNDSEIMHTELNEIKLWEYSSVPWGMNSKTPLIDIKADLKQPELLIKELNSKIEIMTKALRNWDGSDETGENMELTLIQYKQINDLLLKSLEPVVTTTPAIEPVVTTTQLGDDVRKGIEGLIDGFILNNQLKWQTKLRNN